MNPPSEPDPVRSWFDSAARVEALWSESISWLGTPFLANGHAKREGVCCHMLCYLIYRNIGALPEWHDLPRSGTRIGDQLKVRRMSSWLASKDEFVEVDPAATKIGDLITMRPASGENHMGIRLPLQRFVHVTRHRGVAIHHLTDPTYGEAIVAAWRIKNNTNKGIDKEPKRGQSKGVN